MKTLRLRLKIVKWAILGRPLVVNCHFSGPLHIPFHDMDHLLLAHNVIGPQR